MKCKDGVNMNKRKDASKTNQGTAEESFERAGGIKMAFLKASRNAEVRLKECNGMVVILL